MLNLLRLLLIGRAANAAARPGSHAEVKRAWNKGGTIELVLPVEPRLLEANPKAAEARNQVAVARGPVVCALESFDLPSGVKPIDAALPVTAKLTARHDASLPGGVTVLEGEGRLIPQAGWPMPLYRPVKPGKMQRLFEAWSTDPIVRHC